MNRSRGQVRSSDYSMQQPSGRSGRYGESSGPYVGQQGYRQYDRSAYAGSPYQSRADSYSGDAPAINRYSRSSVPPVSYYPPQGHEKRRGGLLPVVIAAILCLVLGFVACYLLFVQQPHTLKPVPSILGAHELDSVVGYYTFDGEVYSITAQDAIEASVSLESVGVPNGYVAPTADMVLSYARNQILASLASSRGISVAPNEVDAYALSNFGSSDYEYLGSYLNMSSDQARVAITEAATVQKLRVSVLGSMNGAPVPPSAPLDGNTEIGTAHYADYIIGLLGSHWDSVSRTWANTSNPYYAALSSMVFAPGSASYDAAQVAYGIAFEQSMGFSDVEAWAEFVNDTLSACSISIATLSA